MRDGPVVASEIGDRKRETVYFGDTINTAARILAACKRLREQHLISDELVRALGDTPPSILRLVGLIDLAGKTAPVALSAVDFW
ncbi:MAG: adenylate cyclase [Gammaproteobacteria bacterium]|jgi:adenylate cyclase